MRKLKGRILNMAVLVVALLTVLGFTARADETPETEPEGYTVDTESVVWQVCDALSEELSAKQILVYDTVSDRILYTKTVEGGKIYPASITKLFTSYVALQHMAPSEVITAGEELKLVREGSSMAYIYKNQSVKVRTAIAGMMLPSGNDAAMVLAAAAGRKIAGDDSLSSVEAVRAFVAEMNRMAKELGFEKTHFTSPDGFHMGSHYTCVNDLVRMAKLALADETISKYMQYAGINVTYVSGQTNSWLNTNLLLQAESPYYRADAIGMKTGYTNQAGYSLMSAFTCGEGALVIGVFGCATDKGRFEDAIKLADACLEVLQ